MKLKVKQGAIEKYLAVTDASNLTETNVSEWQTVLKTNAWELERVFTITSITTVEIDDIDFANYDYKLEVNLQAYMTGTTDRIYRFQFGTATDWIGYEHSFNHRRYTNSNNSTILSDSVALSNTFPFLVSTDPGTGRQVQGTFEFWKAISSSIYSIYTKSELALDFYTENNKEKAIYAERGYTNIEPDSALLTRIRIMPTNTTNTHLNGKIWIYRRKR